MNADLATRSSEVILWHHWAQKVAAVAAQLGRAITAAEREPQSKLQPQQLDQHEQAIKAEGIAGAAARDHVVAHLNACWVEVCHLVAERDVLHQQLKQHQNLFRRYGSQQAADPAAATSSFEVAASSPRLELLQAHELRQKAAAAGAAVVAGGFQGSDSLGLGLMRSSSSGLLHSPVHHGRVRGGDMTTGSDTSSSASNNDEASPSVLASSWTKGPADITMQQQQQQVLQQIEMTEGGKAELAAKDVIIGQLAAEVATLADTGARAAALEVLLAEAKDSNKALKQKVEAMAATLAALEGHQQQQQEEQHAAFAWRTSQDDGWSLAGPSSNRVWSTGGASRPSSSRAGRISNSSAVAGLDGAPADEGGAWAEPWPVAGTTGGSHSGRAADAGRVSVLGQQVGTAGGYSRKAPDLPTSLCFWLGPYALSLKLRGSDPFYILWTALGLGKLSALCLQLFGQVSMYQEGQ